MGLPKHGPRVPHQGCRDRGPRARKKCAWAESSTFLQNAVELLPHVSPRSIRHTDKQHMLADYAGLAPLAAAAALNAGKPAEHALRLLELGRGIIAGLLLEMRSDVSELREEFPALADKFIAIRDELDEPAELQASSGHITHPIGAVDNIPTSLTIWDAQVRRRLNAEEEFSRLLDLIRSKPGFENFLLPPTTAEMRAAADPDPIVVVNMSPYRCGAVLVQRNEIRAVELSLEVYLNMALQAARLQGAGSQASASEITPVLKWLWDTVARPSLNGLGIQGPVQRSDDGTTTDWPHVWWILSGSLTQLPIHAAGLYHSDRPGSVDGESVLDRTMSSYALSIKALIYGRRLHAHESYASPPPAKALLVAMETTPMQSPLPAARTEVEMLASLCPSLRLQPIIPPSRKRDVLEHLAACRIFHFAGHGRCDPSEPSKSCLMLDDWQTAPLEVGDFRGHGPGLNHSENAHQRPYPPPFLGYLSACSTGANEAVHLADEGVPSSKRAAAIGISERDQYPMGGLGPALCGRGEEAVRDDQRGRHD